MNWGKHPLAYSILENKHCIGSFLLCLGPQTHTTHTYTYSHGTFGGYDLLEASPLGLHTGAIANIRIVGNDDEVHIRFEFCADLLNDTRSGVSGNAVSRAGGIGEGEDENDVIPPFISHDSREQTQHVQCVLIEAKIRAVQDESECVDTIAGILEEASESNKVLLVATGTVCQAGRINNSYRNLSSLAKPGSRNRGAVHRFAAT